MAKSAISIADRHGGRRPSHLIWDTQNIVAELDSGNTTVAAYTLAPQGYGSLISQRRSGVTSYHHYDALGSTDRLTDTSQAAVITYLYRGFGQQSVLTGSSSNPFTWLGRMGYYRQGDAGNYWVRARTYQPTIGRFLSLDPARRGLNLYVYVNNRVIVLVDPSGLVIWWPWNQDRITTVGCGGDRRWSCEGKVPDEPQLGWGVTGADCDCSEEGDKKCKILVEKCNPKSGKSEESGSRKGHCLDSWLPLKGLLQGYARTSAKGIFWAAFKADQDHGIGSGIPGDRLGMNVAQLKLAVTIFETNRGLESAVSAAVKECSEAAADARQLYRDSRGSVDPPDAIYLCYKCCTALTGATPYGKGVSYVCDKACIRWEAYFSK